VKVSVIIVNYNTFQLTNNCIRSVLDQTHHQTLEVIVVDNASVDRSAADFAILFPGVIVIQNSTNEGFAKANNKGIARATGDYILLLNSDTQLMNDAIHEAFTFLELNRSVAAVSGKLFYPDGRVQHNCQQFPSLKLKIFELFRLQKIFTRKLAGKILMGSFFSYDRTAYPDWTWATFLLFPKNILKQFPDGKLSEKFFLYGEDMLWCKQFRKLGFKIGFTPNAHILHLHGQSKGDAKKMIDANLNEFMIMYYNGIHRVLIKVVNFLLTGRYRYA
jgi:GT2 family glycosyltransferase